MRETGLWGVMCTKKGNKAKRKKMTEVVVKKADIDE